MKYFEDKDDIPDSKFKDYLLDQEKLVLQCLRLENRALKPSDMKSFFPELARYWKHYVNLPSVDSSNQKIGIVHCASLVRFSRLHKSAEDYRITMNDPEQVEISNLELSLRQTTTTIDDMVLVRDLR